MRVPVMDIRIMRMSVRQWLVPVPVHMRLLSVPPGIVRMLMMFVMHMQVLMLDGLMRVLVFMMLAQMQPDAECHQGRRDPEHTAR